MVFWIGNTQFCLEKGIIGALEFWDHIITSFASIFRGNISCIDYIDMNYEEHLNSQENCSLFTDIFVGFMLNQDDK